MIEEPYTSPKPRRYLPPAPTLLIRPGSSDAKAVDEVWEKGTYTRRVVPHIGETWVDAGSCVGAFSLLLHAYGAGIIAIEPEPANYDLTCRNLAGTGASTRHAALVAPGSPPTVTLNVNADPRAYWRHSTVKARRKSTPLQVPALTPNDIEAEYGPVDGWKMDIEGSEIALLQAWSPPAHCRALLAEWSFDCDFDLAPLRVAVDRLAAAGMTVWLDRQVPWERGVWPASWQPPALTITAWRGPADRSPPSRRSNP